MLCQNAQGGNLREKIQALGSAIVLPKELLEGLNVLRLLGNDAAHVKASVFSEIGDEEIETSIEFTKEVLKATYQHGALLERLHGLKKKQSETPPTTN